MSDMGEKSKSATYGEQNPTGQSPACQFSDLGLASSAAWRLAVLPCALGFSAPGASLRQLPSPGPSCWQGLSTAVSQMGRAQLSVVYECLGHTVPSPGTWL